MEGWDYEWDRIESIGNWDGWSDYHKRVGKCLNVVEIGEFICPSV